MGRPRIGETVMTPAERQRRRRAKLRETIDPARVLADLDRGYRRAFFADQDAIRSGVRKLLARWEKDVAANKEWWRKQRKRSRR